MQNLEGIILVIWRQILTGIRGGQSSVVITLDESYISTQETYLHSTAMDDDSSNMLEIMSQKKNNF